MADITQYDADPNPPTGSVEDQGAKEPKDPLKYRQPFIKLARELTPEELNQTGVQKMILDALSRLEQDNVILGRFREQFYTADKEVVRLKENLKSMRSGETVFGLCMAIGGALLCYGYDNGWLLLFLGVALMGIGIYARSVML